MLLGTVSEIIIYLEMQMVELSLMIIYVGPCKTNLA